ncbi:MAG: OsmC family peroxiredoxin [Pirellulaceae bacterium]|jgi:osmotically inducible protein OsmC|nr:OsmC family peroxiredoxin [Pirellulaceae bacterium]
MSNMKSIAVAVWHGGLYEGQGHLSSGNAAFDGIPFAPIYRNEGPSTTNPEELLAAAHATCYSLALSTILGTCSLAPVKIETEATVTLEKGGEGLKITRSHLNVRAMVPGATPEQFIEAAKRAEVECPISKLMQLEITLEAHLVDVG